jgi:hypothetical protein
LCHCPHNETSDTTKPINADLGRHEILIFEAYIGNIVNVSEIQPYVVSTRTTNGKARAKVTAPTLLQPASCKAEAAATNVAPVVSTSSTKIILVGLGGSVTDVEGEEGEGGEGDIL